MSELIPVLKCTINKLNGDFKSDVYNIIIHDDLGNDYIYEPKSRMIRAYYMKFIKSGNSDAILRMIHRGSLVCAGISNPILHFNNTSNRPDGE